MQKKGYFASRKLLYYSRHRVNNQENFFLYGKKRKIFIPFWHFSRIIWNLCLEHGKQATYGENIEKNPAHTSCVSASCIHFIDKYTCTDTLCWVTRYGVLCRWHRTRGDLWDEKKNCTRTLGNFRSCCLLHRKRDDRRKNEKKIVMQIE